MMPSEPPCSETVALAGAMAQHIVDDHALAADLTTVRGRLLQRAADHAVNHSAAERIAVAEWKQERITELWDDYYASTTLEL